MFIHFYLFTFIIIFKHFFNYIFSSINKRQSHNTILKVTIIKRRLIGIK